MYRCNDCNHYFETPKVVTDEEGDEQYDLCPKCESDNFKTINIEDND